MQWLCLTILNSNGSYCMSHPGIICSIMVHLVKRNLHTVSCDQDVPLPRHEEEAVMDAEAAENVDEEDIL